MLRSEFKRGVSRAGCQPGLRQMHIVTSRVMVSRHPQMAVDPLPCVIAS